MCDTCFTHTKSGKYWFKDAKRYARQMYHRVHQDQLKEGIRSKRIKGGTAGYEAALGGLVGEAIEAHNLNENRFPELMRKVNKMTNYVQGAQVLTLEDAIDIVDLSSPICFISCACRENKLGYIEKDRSKMTCLGLGIGMFRWERFPGRYPAGAEFVDHDEAIEWLKTWNKEGLVQTMMQFGMRNGGPYVGGICNCSRPDCSSIENRLRYGYKQLIKGERVAILDVGKCNGCNVCVSRCQFGAIATDPRQKRVQIDAQMCFGCGLCENACRQNAISLHDRRDYLSLRYDW